MASTLTVDNIVGATTAANVKLPAGHVVQFVNNYKTTSSTDMTADTTTYTACTGCQVVITPKYSNSIIYGLVCFNYWFGTNADHNDYCVSTVYRNNSVNLASDQSLVVVDHATGSALQWNAPVGDYASNNRSVMHDFKDAPGTTSATTYTLYCRNQGTGGSNLSVNWNSQAAAMTVWEIAQ